MMRDEHLQAANMLDRGRRALAAETIDRQCAAQPEVASRYSAAGFPDLLDDTSFRLACLSAAVATDRHRLFVDQVAWLKVALSARRLPAEFLAGNLEAMADAVGASLPRTSGALAQACLHEALRALPTMPAALPSRLTASGPLRDVAKPYFLALLELRTDDGRALLARALGGGATVADLARHVVMFVQVEVGRMWQMDELSVAEEHLVSELNEANLRWLYDQAPRAPRQAHRALCASVSGDLHRLGVRWVASEFEVHGWDVVHLGANMPGPELGHAMVEFDCEVLCLTASLVTHVRSAADAIAAVRAATTRPVTILVGGAPFASVPDLWAVVGADATAADPIAAVAAADGFVRRR